MSVWRKLFFCEVSQRYIFVSFFLGFEILMREFLQSDICRAQRCLSQRVRADISLFYSLTMFPRDGAMRHGAEAARVQQLCV